MGKPCRPSFSGADDFAVLPAARLDQSVLCGLDMLSTPNLGWIRSRLVVGLLIFDLRYQFFLHTEARISFGPLEWLLNTPTHHRVHHGSNRPYLDRNYGGVVIVFDRLFGTFAREQANEPIRYGLLGHAPERNPVKLAFREWVAIWKDVTQAHSIGEALRYMLAPRGAPFGGDCRSSRQYGRELRANDQP